MLIAWTLIVGCVVGWLVYTVVQLNRRLRAQETLLNAHATAFMEFMHAKASELQALVVREISRIETDTAARVTQATVQVEDKFKRIHEEIQRNLDDAHRIIQGGASKVKAQADALLKSQVADFQVLMKKAYLAEYEKMRKNPPRPKKGPRKKVDPPSQYRSIDDE